jgi:hypothetical protein
MSVASDTAERSFSVLRCLKNYVWSTIKNDRLSSHGLVHIHRDFEVDVYKAVVDKSLLLVMIQWVSHLATSLLKSSQ